MNKATIIDLIVDTEVHTQSINHIIKQQHISQRMRRRLKNEGVITVNGAPATWDTLVHGGDRIVMALKPDRHIKATAMELDILYEDDSILIINKAPGLLMHPTSTVRDGTLANGVMHYYKKTRQQYDFHPVHRLDKDTSGVIIIAKTAVVQHAFTRERTRFYKVYDAVTDGHIPAGSLTLRWPIGRKPGSIIERCCTSAGKPARTDITVIGGTAEFTHVRCLLHTGRTHQIRVHLAHLGFPLSGDDIYGGALTVITRQALHAGYLAFTHPVLHTHLEIYAPVPKDMQKLLALCHDS